MLEHEIDGLERDARRASADAFAEIIRKCASSRALPLGTRIHRLLLARGYGGHRFLGNLLVHMYARCGSVVLAREAFDAIHNKNEHSVSAMIGAYAQQSLPGEIIKLFQHLPRWGISPDEFVLASVVNACAAAGDISTGRSIHDQIEAGCCRCDCVLRAALIGMYVKCGSLGDARRVLDSSKEQHVITWTAMISGYIQHGAAAEGIRLFRVMDLEGVKPDAFAFASLVAACSSTGDLKLGKSIHLRVQSVGLETDTALQNSLVNMYSKCGSMLDGGAVFHDIRQKTVWSWASMITAYTRNGHYREAWRLYNEMAIEGVEPDPVTYISLLPACPTIQEGRRIHERAVRCGIHQQNFENALLKMYVGFGHLELALGVLEQMQTRNVTSWTLMISAFAEGGSRAEAMQLFRRMNVEGDVPNKITFVKVLSACSWTPPVLRELHEDLSLRKSPSDRLSEVAGTALLDAYAKCGCLEDAENVFREWESKDSVFCNAMINAYTQAGHSKEAMATYLWMCLEGIPPDGFTFSGILGACTDLGDLKTGKRIVAQLLASGHDSNVVVQNSIVTMLARCGNLEEASDYFERMRTKNVISWTSMIGGYAQCGEPSRALELYKRMDVEPNVITYAAVLDAVCSLGEVQEARNVHSRFISSGLQSEKVDTTLLNLYAKSGFVTEARCLFEKIRRPDSVCWNAMIGAYAQHGQEEEVIELFHRMIVEGEEPSYVTFVSLLIACSRAGLLEECCKYFASMVLDHGLSPVPEHFVCIIDLLGRLGRLRDAEDMINSMPMAAGPATWRTLLGACRIHDDPECASRVSDNLNPGDGIGIILLSNIYASPK